MIRVLITRIVATCLLFAATLPAHAEQPAPGAAAPARIMFLGLFHFDNPGLDAVKFTPIDVMQPAGQSYLAALSERIARFAPTRVLLEYPAESDEKINQRFSDYLAGNFELPKNEIYQLGFRVAKLAGHARVHGIDVPAPPFADLLWNHLSKVPVTEKKLMDLIASESQRLETVHRTLPLREILAMENSTQEELRNKGFYMLLNDVEAESRLFYGADSSAHWWHRNFRMYALIQMHAQPGERLFVIAGSGHTAILRDLLRADSARVEEDVSPYL
jgi:hypothetical protein